MWLLQDVSAGAHQVTLSLLLTVGVLLVATALVQDTVELEETEVYG